MTVRLDIPSENAGPQSVAERVADDLKQQITSGHYAPGDRLPGERQLSESLNVSRVSVRAALQKLKAQGLVSAVQGGGTRVIAKAPQLDAPLAELVLESPDNLTDLMAIKTQLLQWAADRAVIKHLDADVLQLDAIVEDMRRASRPVEVSALDTKFYAHLYRASGSAVFLHLSSVVDDIIMTVLFETDRQQPADVSDAAFFIDCAERALQALRDGKPDALKQCIWENAQRRASLMLPDETGATTALRQAAE